MKRRLSLLLMISAVLIGVFSLGLGAVAAQDATPTAAAADTTPATTPAATGGYLGLQISAADNGAKVEAVVADGPAAAAGIEVGDIITEVDGTVVTFHELHAAVMSHAAGDKLTLSVLRGEETLKLEVTLAERPANMADGTMQHGQGMGGGMGNGQGMGMGDMGSMMQMMPQEMHDCMMQAMPDMQGMDMGKMTPEEMQSMMQSMTPEQMQSMMQAMQGCMGGMNGAGGMNGGMGGGMDMGGGMMQAMPGCVTVQVNPTDGSGVAVAPDAGMMQGCDAVMVGHGMLLGVEYASLSESNAKEYNTTQTSGALLLRVLTDSAAAKGGLLAQDIILAVNGEAIDANHSLADRLSGYKAADEVTFDVIRAGANQQVKVTLEEMAMPQTFFFSQAVPGGMGHDGMGHGSMGGGMGNGNGQGMGGGSGSMGSGNSGGSNSNGQGAGV